MRHLILSEYLVYFILRLPLYFWVCRHRKYERLKGPTQSHSVRDYYLDALGQFQKTSEKMSYKPQQEHEEESCLAILP